MTFLGNSTRPDLKVGDTPERGVRGSDTRFLGEVNSGDSDISPPSFVGDARVQPSAAPTPPERCTNVIATGARWKGSLKVDDSVRIDGQFAGDIDAKGTVQITESADVDAKVHAAFIVVSGSFKGEIRGDQRVELMPRSKVSGEVITKVLSVHEGAILDGSVQMTGETVTRLNGRSRNGAAETESAAERTSRRSEPAAAAE